MEFKMELAIKLAETVALEHGRAGHSLEMARTYCWLNYDFDAMSEVFGAEAGRTTFEAAHARGSTEHHATWPVRYTLAPASYDGFGTIDRGVECYEAGGRCRPYRKVSINPAHLEWQTLRYRSGNCVVVDKVGLDELALAGLVTWQHPGGEQG